MATTLRPSSTFTRALREHQDIGAEHAGDGARGADVGHVRFRHREILGERRRDAGQQIEEQVFGVAEAVLDVVAEDPQVEHVAAQVQPAAVHEHGAEHRGDVAGGIGGEAGRNEGPLLDERVAVVELEQEDEGVDGDQGIGDVRGRTGARNRRHRSETWPHPPQDARSCPRSPWRCQRGDLHAPCGRRSPLLSPQRSATAHGP